MDEVAIDVEQARAIILTVDHMVVPDLVIERAGRSVGGHVYLFLLPACCDPARFFDFLILRSGRRPRLDEDSRAAMRASHRPLELRVFYP